MLREAEVLRPRGPDISDVVASSGASVCWHLEDGVHHDVFLYPWCGGVLHPHASSGGSADTVYKRRRQSEGLCREVGSRTPPPQVGPLQRLRVISGPGRW